MSILFPHCFVLALKKLQVVATDVQLNSSDENKKDDTEEEKNALRVLHCETDHQGTAATHN